MPEPTTPRARVLRARDFKGWEVRDAQGEKVGSVAELLLDRDGRVRYVDLDFGLLRKHVLVPEPELEWADDALVLRRWAREQVKLLPPYQSDRPLTDELLEEMERAFPGYYGGGETPAAPGVPLPQAKGFRLESGASDPRGWTVFGSDGERVGTVAQILVDPEALKVRALEVDVLEDLFHLEDDRRVLVAIEDVELKDRGEDVWVQTGTAEQIARRPAYVRE